MAVYQAREKHKTHPRHLGQLRRLIQTFTFNSRFTIWFPTIEQ